MANINQKIAGIFKEMSTIYDYLGGKQKFRARAYDKAARVVSNLNEPVKDSGKSDLESIDGIGDSIASEIKEFLESGKIERHKKLKEKIPSDFIDLLEVKGFGPESLKKLNEELGLNTKSEIKGALENGEVSELKGLGKKTAENMLKGLEMESKSNQRIILWKAISIAEEIKKKLLGFDGVNKAEIAGSIRRRKETAGDIDILITCEDEKVKDVLNAFTNLDLVKEVLAKGNTKSSVVIEDENRQVDVRVIPEEYWGAALHYFTGSKEHNVRIRQIAKDKNLKVSEYGLFDKQSDEKIESKTEKKIYEALEMSYVPPELREDRGEIDLARKNEIPDLIELDDIKADMHMHSNWTDGRESIADLANYIRSNFNYEFMCLTDHSQAVNVAGGLDEEEVLKQLNEIKKVNEELGEDFIKTGIEVDILKDGSLDLDDEVLKELNWVIASIHYNLDQDNTERLVKACQNKFVCAIGHPTGRLINSREEYEIDQNAFLDAAQENDVALEINAQPKRTDLNDRWVRKARERGIKLVVNTDTHYTKNLEFMANGVFVARRAGCTKKDILNTQSWTEIKKWIDRKRQ